MVEEDMCVCGVGCPCADNNDGQPCTGKNHRQIQQAEGSGVLPNLGTPFGSMGCQGLINDATWSLCKSVALFCVGVLLTKKMQTVVNEIM